MKLVVGLGNPGRKYEQTRHNIGFMVAGRLAAMLGIGNAKVRFEGEYAEALIGGDKMAILLPQTMMNRSGQSVRKACEFFKLPYEDLLVICDDLNLATGRLRIRPSGSAGGNNGLKDIIRHLQTEDFARLRIGIDRPPQHWATSDYVLGKFSGEEKDRIETSIGTAAQAAVDWAQHGVGFVMNRYNADPVTQKPTKKKPVPSKTTPNKTTTNTAATSKTTAPNTTAPNTTVPNTTVPNTTVPNTTVPNVTGAQPSAADLDSQPGAERSPTGRPPAENSSGASRANQPNTDLPDQTCPDDRPKS